MSAAVGFSEKRARGSNWVCGSWRRMWSAWASVGWMWSAAGVARPAVSQHLAAWAACKKGRRVIYVLPAHLQRLGAEAGVSRPPAHWTANPTHRAWRERANGTQSGTFGRGPVPA